MNFLTLIYPVLDSLQKGKVIRYYVAWLLRLFGVAIVLAGLYAIIQLFKLSLQSPDATYTIAGFLACAIIAIAVFLVLQVCLYRAEKIIELGDSEFTVIPVISQYLRWIGEVLASVVIVIGLVAIIFFIFVGSQGNNPAQEYLPRYLQYGSSPIVILLALPFVTVVYSLGFIIFFYFLAELVNVNVDMARNIRKLVDGSNSPFIEEHEEIITETNQPQSGVFCPACGTENAPDDIFCANCGSKLHP